MIKKMVLMSVMMLCVPEIAFASFDDAPVAPQRDIFLSIANGLSDCVCNHTAYASLGAIVAMETLDCYKFKFEHKPDQKIQNFMKSLSAVALVPVSMVATTWVGNQLKSVITPAVAAGLVAAGIMNKYVKDLPQMKDMIFKIGAVAGSILIAQKIMQ